MPNNGLKNFPRSANLGKGWAIAGRALAIGLLSLSVQGSQNVDSPCADCGPLHLRATQSLSGLTGCYLAGYGKEKTQIRINRISDDSYELDLRKSISRNPFLLLRTAEWQDLKTVAAGFGMPLEDGITVPEGANFNPNPVGIYRGRDASGKRITFAYLLFYNGNLEPTPCENGL